MRFILSRDPTRSNAPVHSIGGFRVGGGISRAWLTRQETDKLRMRVSMWIDAYRTGHPDEKLVLEMTPDEAESMANQLLNAAKHTRTSAENHNKLHPEDIVTS